MLPWAPNQLLGELPCKGRSSQCDEMFRHTFERASVGMAHVALDGRFLAVNPHLCNFLGYSREELLNLSFGEITHPDDLAPDWQNARALLEGLAESYAMDKRYVHKDGRTIWARLTGSIIRDAKARPQYYIAIIQDISREKSAEAANQAKSSFLSSMSHELRTPLSGIYGLTQLLLNGDYGELNPLQSESLTDILQAAEHLLQLINGLLDLAKVEAGKWEITPEPTDPNQILVQVAGALEGMSSSGKVEVLVLTDDSLPRIYTDPRLFRQIVYNYLSNAIKFTPPGGRITLSLSRGPAGLARIEVCDTGIGIEPHQIGRLFQAFEQIGGTPRGKLKGTGLGLALVKQFATMQGGTVGVESVAGKGSRFWALLPVNEEKMPAL